MGRASGVIACPRCGYDLRTGPALWEGFCPLEGRCVECGLDFEWAELLSSKRVLPRWYVEACRWWRLPWAIVVTAVVALWPPVLWRRVGLAHDVRCGRLVVLVLVLLLAVLHGALAGHVRGAWLSSDPNPSRYTVSPTARWRYVAHCIVRPWDVTQWTVPAGAATWRAWPFPTPSPPVPLTPPRLVTRRCLQLVELRVGAVIFAGVAAVAMPVLLVALLPASRRKVRVRPRHIARAALLGAVLPIVFAGIMLLPPLWFGKFQTWSVVQARPPSIMLLLCIAAMLTWWWFAVRSYMRLPHAAGVVVGLGTIALLLGLAAVLVYEVPGVLW